MKVLVVSLCFLCLAFPAVAKSKHAPPPNVVLHAKTVYILNETGMQKIGDVACEDIEKWRRFSIASNRKSADLIVRFVSRDTLRDGTTRPTASMVVTAPDSNDPLFRDTSRPHFSWGAVVHSNTDAFRDWLEGN